MTLSRRAVHLFGRTVHPARLGSRRVTLIPPRASGSQDSHQGGSIPTASPRGLGTSPQGVRAPGPVGISACTEPSCRGKSSPQNTPGRWVPRTKGPKEAAPWFFQLNTPAAQIPS